jgi:hypothetical protein
VAETLADVSRLEGTTRLSLQNFGAAEVGALMSAAGSAETPTELAVAMKDLTGGTPFFLCELWRELRAGDAVEVSETGLRRLTRPLADLRGPTGRFTHELVRRAVYDRLPSLSRAQLHLQVGEALERLHRDDLDRVLPELAHPSRMSPRSPAPSAESTTTSGPRRQPWPRPPWTKVQPLSSVPRSCRAASREASATRASALRITGSLPRLS